MSFYESGPYRCLVTDQAFQTAKSGIPMVVFRIRPEYLLSEHVGRRWRTPRDEEQTLQQYERTCWFAIIEKAAVARLRHAEAASRWFHRQRASTRSTFRASRLCRLQAPNPTRAFYVGAVGPGRSRASKPAQACDSSLARNERDLLRADLTDGASAAPPLVAAALAMVRHHSRRRPPVLIRDGGAPAASPLLCLVCVT